MHRMDSDRDLDMLSEAHLVLYLLVLCRRIHRLKAISKTGCILKIVYTIHTM